MHIFIGFALPLPGYDFRGSGKALNKIEKMFPSQKS
jgi:hypothetical protein